MCAGTCIDASSETGEQVGTQVRGVTNSIWLSAAEGRILGPDWGWVQREGDVLPSCHYGLKNKQNKNALPQSWEHDMFEFSKKQLLRQECDLN